MKRRDFIKKAGIVGAGALVLSNPLFARKNNEVVVKKPNIILMMSDDQGWGSTGYMGHPYVKTPNLDKMASNGVRFDRFYAAHPLCSPTRGSLLTGRNPNRFNCIVFGKPLPLKEYSLAKAMKTSGYTTGHFGKWHLGGFTNEKGGKPNHTAKGYLLDKNGPHPGNHGFDEWFSHYNYFESDTYNIFHNGKKLEQQKGESSELIVNASIRWINKCVETDKAFFTILWFPSPHPPFSSFLSEDIALYKGKKGSGYMAEITAMDRAIGTLRAHLRKLKIADNTIVWFCSDNGAKSLLENGGLTGGKSNVWEGGIRVPSVLEWPSKIKKPFTTKIPCSTSDFFPTMLDIVGGKIDEKVPKPIDGISLLPLIENKMNERPNGIAFSYKGHSVLVEEQYKLHKNYIYPKEKGKNKHSQKDAYLLFDLQKDFAEKNDIAKDNPQVVERMKKHLIAWEKSVENSSKGNDYKEKKENRK